MTDLDVRLVAYAPAGGRLDPLPFPSGLSASFPRNDVGALSVTYSTAAAGGSLLAQGLEDGLEVAVEVTGPDGWVEPAGGRFLLLKRSRDLADPTGSLTLTLPSYGWLARKALNLATADLLPPEHTQAGKRPFYSASAGVIVGTLLAENAARGGVPLVAGFSSVADAAGAAWAQVATIYYDLGISVWSVLDNLAAQGMADWRTTGRTLHLWNADSLATSRELADTVRLHLGRQVSNAPQEESLEDLVSRVMIRGEAGLTIFEDNPAAPKPWGGWEGYLSQGGVSDEGTARTLIQTELARTARVRGQYTRELILPGASILPMVDYGPGDWITAPTTSTSGERVRVQQVTLTRDAKGQVGGNVVLNDRVLDADLRRAKRMVGIVGGSTSDGGSGARPTPEGPDRRTPAAPAGLVIATNAYLDSDGAARGRIEAAWGEVATATDGTMLEVQGYEIWGRLDITGAPWRQLTATTEATGTVDALDVGSRWLIAVRAVGRYTTAPGAWSDTHSIDVAHDVNPPPVPSLPVLTSRLGTVTITWDGHTATGGTMPLDFSHLDVRVDGQVAGALRGSTGQDLLVLTDQPGGTDVVVQLRAVDRSTNASDWTEPATITVVRIEGPDIEANTVTANEIAAGAIQTEHLTSGVVDTTKVALGVLSSNVLRNPGFEDTGEPSPTAGRRQSVPGWTLGAGPSSLGENIRYADPQFPTRAGLGHVLLSHSGDGLEGSSMTQVVTAVPGAAYRATMYARRSGGEADMRLLLVVYTSTTGPDGPWTAAGWAHSAVLTSTYTQTTYDTPTIPADVTHLRYEIRHRGNEASTGGRGYALVDDCALIRLGAAATEITPSGIRMWNAAGVETIALDGQAATIRAGTISGVAITGTTISGGTISGITITANAGIRIMSNRGIAFGSGSEPSIGYAGDSISVYGKMSVEKLLLVDGLLSVVGAVVCADRVDVIGNLYAMSSLYVYGAKHFLMDHPTKPGHSLVHASTESPLPGVHYWGEATLDDRGRVLVTLPDYFEALTRPTARTVHVSAINTPAPLAATRIHPGSGEFEVTGPPRTAFTWLVHAARADVQFSVEPITDPHDHPVPPAPHAPPTETEDTTE